MGNLIVTGASIFIPLFNQLITVPYIYAPTRWGGIPWSPPNDISVNIVRVIFNVILLILFATLSGMMTTEKQCQKHEVFHSMKRSMWVLLGYAIGSVLATCIPVLKAPLLALTIWVPYAAWIAHGIIVAGPILVMGAIGNSYQRHEICV